MKASSFIKKSLIIGLTVSLLSMSVFAQADYDDDEVELLDGEPEIMLIEETVAVPEYETTTGTILVKGKNAKAKVYLTYKGKKKYTLEPAAESLLTFEDLANNNGKIVKLTGNAEKKVFKVVELSLIGADSDTADAK